jgi:hypothetical protein
MSVRDKRDGNDGNARVEDDTGFEQKNVEVRLGGRVILVRVVNEAVTVTKGFGVLANAA